MSVMLMGRSLISPDDLTMAEFERVLDLADDIIRAPKAYQNACRGRVMASLFYEPSTRTKLSFDSAMMRLGGQVIGFSDPMTSSAAKGESLADSARTVSQYADLIVVRHPREGAARLFAQNADCPIINAGDGGHLHPTQTLTDLMTIRHEKGRLSDMTVGLCGDLMFGRTIHSLVMCLQRCPGIRFVFISPRELRMPDYVRAACDAAHVAYTETNELEASMPALDILYMSRVQRERFVSESEYERLKDYFVLTRSKMALARPDMLVLHPLPRVTEIAPEVDADPRAAYFKQVRYGMWARMALIMSLLGDDLVREDETR